VTVEAKPVAVTYCDDPEMLPLSAVMALPNPSGVYRRICEPAPTHTYPWFAS